jgi:hypothetical protein
MPGAGILAGVTLGGCNAQDAHAVATDVVLADINTRLSELEWNTVKIGETYVDLSDDCDPISVFRQVSADCFGW